MTPANSNASTPEEHLYNSFMLDQTSQDSFGAFLSQQSHLHFMPLPSSTPPVFVSHSPMVHMPSVSIGQGWTPVLTNAANTPVVTGVSGSATMSVANGSLHTMSAIAPNLLVADINSSSRTSHFATHFPPLSSVSASQASISVSEYAAAAGNALFLPAGGHSSVGMPVAAGHGSGTATNAIGVVGLGIFGEIVPASHNNIDAAVSSSSSSSSSSSEAMSLYPAISGVQGMVDVRSYPFPATTEIHRPNGSLSFDMETAAQLSDVAAKENIIKGTECVAAVYLSPASIDTPENTKTRQEKQQQKDALGCLMQPCNGHRNENNGNHLSSASSVASTCSSPSSPSISLLDEDPHFTPSISQIPDDCSRPRRKTMSRPQQMAFCKFLLDHPGRPFPKEQDRLRLTVDAGLSKKRFYWWFSNQRHRSFACSVVDGKKHYSPKIQFYRMCVRLGVLAADHVPSKFQAQLKKRRK